MFRQVWIIEPSFFKYDIRGKHSRLFEGRRLVLETNRAIFGPILCCKFFSIIDFKPFSLIQLNVILCG